MISGIRTFLYLFAFGGEHVQEELLKADGIEVVNGRVDLKKYGI